MLPVLVHHGCSREPAGTPTLPKLWEIGPVPFLLYWRLGATLCSCLSREEDVVSSENNVNHSFFQPGVRTSYITMRTLCLKHGSETQAGGKTPAQLCLNRLLRCALCTQHTRHSFGFLPTKLQNILAALSPQPLVAEQSTSDKTGEILFELGPYYKFFSSINVSKWGSLSESK